MTLFISVDFTLWIFQKGFVNMIIFFLHFFKLMTLFFFFLPQIFLLNVSQFICFFIKRSVLFLFNFLLFRINYSVGVTFFKEFFFCKYLCSLPTTIFSTLKRHTGL